MIITIIFDFYIDLRKLFANVFNYIIKILKLFANIFINIIIVINSYLKHIILNEIMIYEKFNIIKSLT